MRVYLPATLPELGDLSAAPLAPRAGHGVTPALRALWPEEDEEGWEYAAQAAAADDSLVRLAAGPPAPALRVVVSADVPADRVRPLQGADAASAVEVLCAVGPGEVVCVHVDEPAAAADVAAAVAGEDAAFDRLDERDLLWYDATEIAQIPDR